MPPHLDVIDVELHAERGQGREDVGKQDDTVGLERVPGLQRDLDDQLRGLGALTEPRVLLGQLAVALLVPAIRQGGDAGR